MSKDRHRYRVLLDEGVPVSFGKYLKNARHNVEHIKIDAQHLMGKDDSRVVGYAVKEKRILIATDADFSHRRSDLVGQIVKLNGAVIRISGSALPESLKIIWGGQGRNLHRYPKGIFVIGLNSCKKLTQG